MSASKKAVNNANRLRYIRALERFHKSIVAYLLNTQELTHEKFDKKIENALKLLLRVEEMDLYKGDFQDLQKLVKKMIAYKGSDEDIESIKNDILYNANQLEKTKNGRRYKKEKHAKAKYADWE